MVEDVEVESPLVHQGFLRLLLVEEEEPILIALRPRHAHFHADNQPAIKKNVIYKVTFADLVLKTAAPGS